MKCTNCGSEQAPDEAQFCPACGQALQETSKPGPSAGITVNQDVGSVSGGRVVGVQTQNLYGDVKVYQVEAQAALFAGVPAMPAHFIGREEVVSALAARLTSGQEAAVALHGLPGVGKTTLAVALAHHKGVLAHFSDGVLWASLGPHGRAFSALAGWAQVLGNDISQMAELDDRRQAVQGLIGQRRVLLVIDDVWEVQAARDLQCGGPNCCYLLTSREPRIAEKFAGTEQTSRVTTLDGEAAYRLLQALAPEACQADPPAARKLSESLGGLPLALELVGGYLADPERSVFPELQAEALAEMADPRRRLELASARLGARRGGEVTLRDTLLFSLETLPEEAQPVFYALGAFAPEPEIFSLEAAKAVTQADDRLLALLVARNLLEKSGGTGVELSLHQVLADLARTRLTSEAIGRHQVYYLGLVKNDPQDWRRIEAAYGQVQWAWAKLPEDQSLLDWVWAVQVFQVRRGLRKDQVAWIERGLRVCEAQGLRTEKGSLLNNLGQVYQSTGQPHRALEIYERALTIAQEEGDRSGEAVTLNNLAGVYFAIGQMQKSLELYNQALSIHREAGQRAQEATTMSNIGEIFRITGQPRKALELYEQALILQRLVGSRAGEATTLNNMGLVYREFELLDRALELFEQALPVSREVGDRAGEATTLINIAEVYQSSRQPQKALELLEQALPIIQEVGDRVKEATALNNMGLAYRDTGQLAKALENYEQALPITRETGDRANEAAVFHNMGLVYDDSGQPQKALELYEQAVPIIQAAGNKYLERVIVLNLALTYRDLGRLPEAVTGLRRVVELERQLGHTDLEKHLDLLKQVEAELAGGE